MSNYVFDFVFILGPDINGTLIIEKLTALKNAGKKVAIIKQPSDYEIIENAIGPHTRIDIFAHGAPGVSNTEHWIKVSTEPLILGISFSHNKFTKTSDFFDYITQLSGNEDFSDLQVHVWSCFGGRAIHSAAHLPRGAALITHGSSDTFTIDNLVYKNALSSLSRSGLNAFEEFKYVLSESAEEVAIAKITENGLFVHRASLTETVLNSTDEIIDHLNQRLTNYSAALKTGEIVFDPLESDITISESQITEYAEDAVYLHASVDNSITYLRTYLERKKIHPAHFLYKGENLPFIAAQRMSRDQNLSYLWNYLIENNVDLNMPMADKASPFLIFIVQDRLDGINFLLDQGVNVNYKMQLGRTSLMFAAHKKKVNIVERLLQQKNVFINAQDDKGFSALMLAAEVGDLSIVNLLIQAGAEPTLRSNVGATALLVAAQNGFFSVAKRLLQHSSGIRTINYATDNNLTPLWLAAKNGHASVVRLLLKYNAYSNITFNYDGSMPVQIALKNNHFDVVQILLQSRKTQLVCTTFDNVVQLSLPPIEIKNTNDIWPCELLNTDALLCAKGETIRYLRSLPKTTASWDVLKQEGDTFICAPLPENNQAMHCVGKNIEYVEWSRNLESAISSDVAMTLGKAAISGITYTVLPEAIGDLFLLLDFLTKENSQKLKFLINIVLIMMTGSLLDVLAALIVSNLLQKIGCSEQSARISGNIAAFFVSSGSKITPNCIAATVVSYGASRFGLFGEKHVVNKLRKIPEVCLNVNDLVINSGIPG